MMFDIFFAQPLNDLARYKRAIAFLSFLERLPLKGLARYLKHCYTENWEKVQLCFSRMNAV